MENKKKLTAPHIFSTWYIQHNLKFLGRILITFVKAWQI